MQKINLKLDFTLREDGGYGYDGKLGPHVEKMSTIFGRSRQKFEDGDIEREIMDYHRELKELYPDRPVVVKLTIQDERQTDREE
jgi:hypothetical protein